MAVVTSGSLCGLKLEVEDFLQDIKKNKALQQQNPLASLFLKALYISKNAIYLRCLSRFKTGVVDWLLAASSTISSSPRLLWDPK